MNKKVKALVAVLMIVLTMVVLYFWIPGAVDRYDRQRHCDVAPDTVWYVLFGIGKDEQSPPPEGTMIGIISENIVQ